MNNRFIVTPLACATLLAGCTVEYKAPPLVATSQDAFIRATSSASVDPPLARGWIQLHDDLLTDLIERAVKSNPSVDVAEARIQEARAALAAEHAKQLPNRSKIDQAKAARDEAEADYRRTVLAALSDAESALIRYGQQRNSVGDYAKVQATAERAYSLTEVRLHAGTASTSDLLDADVKRVQAQMNYQQALAQLSQDFVSLQKSLGLGWVREG